MQGLGFSMGAGFKVYDLGVKAFTAEGFHLTNEPYFPKLETLNSTA